MTKKTTEVGFLNDRNGRRQRPVVKPVIAAIAGDDDGVHMDGDLIGRQRCHKGTFFLSVLRTRQVIDAIAITSIIRGWFGQRTYMPRSAARCCAMIPAS